MKNTAMIYGIHNYGLAELANSYMFAGVFGLDVELSATKEEIETSLQFITHVTCGIEELIRQDNFAEEAVNQVVMEAKEKFPPADRHVAAALRLELKMTPCFMAKPATTLSEIEVAEHLIQLYHQDVDTLDELIAHSVKCSDESVRRYSSLQRTMREYGIVVPEEITQQRHCFEMYLSVADIHRQLKKVILQR